MSCKFGYQRQAYGMVTNALCVGTVIQAHGYNMPRWAKDADGGIAMFMMSVRLLR